MRPAGQRKTPMHLSGPARVKLGRFPPPAEGLTATGTNAYGMVRLQRGRRRLSMVYPFRRVQARQRLRRPWPGRLRAEVQPA